ncbi:hypothetical protein C7H84_27995 [Burkholderia sp. Nafp2/4-1b]|nr:hypothetical protein C7H84_27995 [Burkholderia sp. Nafp2/4-1b]
MHSAAGPVITGLSAHLYKRATAMEKAKPEGAIRRYDSPVCGQTTRASDAHGAAARMRRPAGSAR